MIRTICRLLSARAQVPPCWQAKALSMQRMVNKRIVDDMHDRESYTIPTRSILEDMSPNSLNNAETLATEHLVKVMTVKRQKLAFDDKVKQLAKLVAASARTPSLNLKLTPDSAPSLDAGAGVVTMAAPTPTPRDLDTAHAPTKQLSPLRLISPFMASRASR